MIFDDASVANALEYWTEERMATAIPAERILSDEATDESTPIQALTPEKANTSDEPFNAGGKLYYTLAGKNYSGSAEFCAHVQMIITVAHNIVDKDGNWAHNIVFKKGYGSKATESIPIRAVAVRKAWITSTDLNYREDYGFCVAKKPYPDMPYLDYIEYDNSKEQPATATSFGYPSNYEDGNKMVYVAGGIEIKKILEVPAYWKMPGNPMGPGASGGAWVVKSDTSAASTYSIVSLNSYGLQNEPNTMYGPLLSSDFSALVGYVKTYLVDNPDVGQQEDKDFPSSLENLGDVRHFKIKNRGWFIAHIKVKWKHEDLATGCVSRGEYTTKTDIRKEAEGTLDLYTLGVPDGAIVRMIGEVQAGKDNPGDELFTYNKSSGKMATYKMTRGTQNNKMYLESYQ